MQTVTKTEPSIKRSVQYLDGNEAAPSRSGSDTIKLQALVALPLGKPLCPRHLSFETINANTVEIDLGNQG